METVAWFPARYAGKTVLAVGAHPDDLELGVGGTLARLSRAGARVVMAVASVPNSLERRKEEAGRAAQVLGGEIRFLVGDRCSRVEDLKRHELVGMVDGLVAELAPAAVFSHCLANTHLDHSLVYNACIASQRLRFFDLFCYSPTSCHPMNIGFRPHAYVDIGETIDDKLRAIEVHLSQFSGRNLRTERYRAEASWYGQFVGVKYAEALEVVRIRLN
jgi:LmbE family N-acetylglucosaminyl deacetylase